MQSFRVFPLVLAALAMFTGSALADSIAGKIGVTARGGFTIPADSKFTSGAGAPAGAPTSIETDTGFAVGGGLIYGINDNIAAELDVTYSQFDANYLGIKIIEATTTDISLGLQYRLMPNSKFVPYIGAGIDVLVNDAKPSGIFSGAGDLDVDTSVGGHISVGADYFLTKNIAFNTEFKGVLASEADVKDTTGTKGAQFDPSNFSGLFGVRYFF